MTSHELMGFMPPALAREILEYAFASDKDLYRGTMNAVAEARKLRPVFFERKPRPQRHADMIASLSSPRMEAAAATLIRSWLLKSEKQMLVDFLDCLGVVHKEGVVDDLPEKIEDAKMTAAVDQLIARHPKEKVIIYLNAFQSMNPEISPLLKEMLQSRSELQLA